MLLTLWTTSACWAIWEWLVAKRRIAAIVAGLCLGLATLTKGPVGCVLPILTAMAYLTIRRHWKALWGRDGLLCLGTFLGVTLTWFVPAIAQGGMAYAQATLWHHTLERYVRAWEHTAPWYFYFGAFPAEVLPWTLFLPQALVYGAQQRQPLNERYLIKSFAAVINAALQPNQPLGLCGPLNDLALGFNLGRFVPTLPEIPEVIHYLGGGRKLVDPPDRSTSGVRSFSPVLDIQSTLIVASQGA